MCIRTKNYKHEITMFNQEILDEGFQNPDKNSFQDKKTVQAINAIKVHLNEDIKNVKNARIAVMVLAGLALLSVFVNIFTLGFSMDIFLEGLITVLIYTVCAVGVQHNSKVALLVAFSIFILIWLLTTLVDFSYLYRGFILKGIMLYYFGKGISSAFGMKEKIDQLYTLGLSMEEIERAKSLDLLRPSSIPVN